MKLRIGNTNDIVESIAGAITALSVFLHLSGINLGVFLPAFGAFFAFFSLIRGSITRRQAVSFFLLSSIFILLVTIDLMHESVLLFLLLAANGVVVAGRARALNSFLFTSIGIASLTAVALIVSSPLSFGARASVGGVNPVWQSWLFSFGFSALFFLKTRSFYFKNIALAIIFFALLMSGSRQSLIAVIITIASGFLINGLSIRYVAFSFLAGAGFVAAISARFYDQDGSRGFFEDQTRLDLYIFALEEIAQRPTGHGFGNFTYLHWDYPHNLFLELTHAIGIVGLVSFLVFIGYVLISAIKLPLNLRIIVLPLFILSLVVAQFSGSLASHRQLYFIMGLIMGLSYSRFRDPELPRQSLLKVGK
jgi:O-antigen ligase